MWYDAAIQTNEVIHMMGARIAALRRQAGMSQAELARQLQCSASAVGMYEQGRREPPSDLLVQMAQIFGVTTDYLLTGSAREPQDQQAFADMLRRSLHDADRAAESRKDRPFSRQELAVLLAAMLMEP